MTIFANTKVAELINEEPSRAKVFEKYNIDYCCGGQISLEEVCKNLSIPVDKVVSELEALAVEKNQIDSTDWSKQSLSTLIKHIVEVHHTYLTREFPRISEMLEKVVKVHSKNHKEIIELKSVFENLRFAIEQHTYKEENVLFPMCFKLEESKTKPTFHCGSITNPLSVMELEHDNAGEALKKMRALTDNYKVPDDACPTYKVLFDSLIALEKDLQMHVHKENNILHPMIRELNDSLP